VSSFAIAAAQTQLPTGNPGRPNQTPTTQGPGKPKEPPTERTFRGAPDERTSRDLFTACDGDGNDRLDIFEVSQCLDAMRTPQDAEPFRRLDSDRSGYLNWPEFDAYYRRTLNAGATFRVRPLRKSVLPQPEAKSSSPMQRFVQMHDKNGNGSLDPTEIEQFLLRASLPPALATELRQLDADRSGRVDPAELRPWFDRVSGQSALALERATADSRLPPPWNHADGDANGLVDDVEVGRLLSRLDPRLAGWAVELHRRWDQNRDGVLQPTELVAIPLQPKVEVAPK
jgi:Ca2+-binding EF-hand superfamily protein